MRTSPSRSALADHTSEPIPVGTFGYIRARAKRRMFTILTEEFKNAGITKAELARRANMDPARITKLLASPMNWEYETLCDLFYAISGRVLSGAELSVARKASMKAEDDTAKSLGGAPEPPDQDQLKSRWPFPKLAPEPPEYADAPTPPPGQLEQAA